MYIKKIRSVFNKNIDQFCILKKSDLYLMKIQICFMLKKSNLKNTDQFFELEKKIKSVFNENTYLFYVKKIRSKKYRSIFKLEKNHI